MLVLYHFCDDAMACLTYDSNNFDPTFCNNWVASILQLPRVITGHTADNTTCCKTSPIQPGYHSMPGHATRYRSYTSIQGCFMPDTSVHRFMPGHVTCYTSDTFVQRSVQCCFMPCYFMPGHATHYLSDTSVQRHFMPGHVTHYPSDTSVQCRFMPGHATHYPSDTSIQCCFIPGHVTCYASDTSVQSAGHVACCASLQCCFMPGHATCDTFIQRRFMSGLATCYALYHYISGYLTGLFAFPIYFLKFDPSYYATNPCDISIIFGYNSIASGSDFIQVPNLAANNNNSFLCGGTHNFSSRFFFKHWNRCKHHKQSALFMVQVINHSIYYFMNGNLNHSQDVVHLIECLLMALQRYITLHIHFKYHWFILLLHGLLRSQHISLWVLVILFRRLYMIRRVFKLQIIYNMIPKKKKKLFLYLYLCFVPFCIWSILDGLGHSLKMVQNRNLSIRFVGGGKSFRTSYEYLKPFIISTEHQIKHPENYSYIFDGHFGFDKAMQKINASREKYFLCNVPLSVIADNLTTGQANEVAKEHNLHALSRKSLAEKQLAIKSYLCTKFCMQSFTLFKAVNKNLKSVRQQNNAKEKKLNTHPKVGKKSSLKSSRIEQNHKHYTRKNMKFPPSPPSQHLMHKIISGFCDDIHPSKFEEAGCAVCGQLVIMSSLTKLSDIKCSFDPLVCIGKTRLPRSSADEQIKEIHGPIIDSNCKHVCHKCITFLSKKRIPPMALANGLWVGDVPKELSDLTFVERLLIACVRSNCCIVHVLKGGWKMRANAIMFPSPISKLCNILPPPIEELDEVIAFMFTGVDQPTVQDMKRTPMLAHRQYISVALEWLKLNHSDYADVQISQENLKLYPEEGPPVTIDYQSSIINKHKEETSVFDMEEEEGVQDGECSFVVHGIMGENYSTLSKDATRALALQHLINDKNIAFVGHGSKPESMFNNSQLFPSMMPWLFPYGLGGIGNSKIMGRMSSISQKKYLLMYHDKRFQTDPGFPLIAFNQEQIQESTSAGFVTAEKAYLLD